MKSLDILLSLMLCSMVADLARAETTLKFTDLEDAKAPSFLDLERRKLLRKAKDSDPGAELLISVAWFDLNLDGQNDLCVSYSSAALHGRAGAEIACFLKGSGGSFREVVRVSGAPEVVVLPGSKTKGHFDLTFGGPGFQKPYVWKWTGTRYH
jgi:hypothetical protein